ncbi:MAG TPA: efflux RND transporter periplasmic adaptor subunit [Candidatus Binatia bacterium]|nr:efflux RND transporter periplasmic adaptor subunit [Candidatus Binatia bacterium]
MKRLLILLTAIATGPLLAGCHKTPEPARTELPAATVQVQTVEKKSRVATEDVVGTVRPKLSAAIEAKISGRIEHMLVVPGQTVKEGQTLAKLDAHEVQARLDQATATRQQAESDFKRANDLMAQKILSQSEFDSAQSKFRMAVAAETEAKTLLSYTEIVAPFDGVITRKLADMGDLAMPGKPVLQMENPNTLRLEADVPEALIDDVKLGDQFAVRIATITNEIQGTVAEMSPAADPNSRTFLVKLDLPTTPGLRSGQFGRVAVPVGKVSAIRVPTSAVIQRGQMELVFVATNGDAQLRLVKTGRRVDDEMEVVSGLNSGEAVVTQGASELTDGQPVTIQK